MAWLVKATRILKVSVVLGLMAVLPAAVRADEIVLTVDGLVSGSQAHDFSIADLEELGLEKVVTETPWHNGVHTFEGVLVRDLMQAVGARGEVAIVTALNNYVAEVPLAEFSPYPVILAFKLDGAYMRVEDKGPLFIIYPFSDYPELQTELNYTHSVWQVRSITVE